MEKPTAKIQTRKIKIGHDLVEYAVRKGGTKKILFLHGLNTSLQFWKKILPEISPEYSCYAPSLPKYGQRRIDHYLKTVEKFLALEKLDNPFVVGHSLGGIITLRLISRGVKFKKVVLVNVPLFSHPPDLTVRTFNFWKRKLEGGPLIKKTFLLIPKRIKRFKKFFLRAPLESYLEGFSDVIQNSIEPDVRKLDHKIPLLIVDGRFDFLLWACRGKALYQKLKPEAIVKLYATHFIPESHPQRLARVINQFFRTKKLMTGNDSALFLPKFKKEILKRISAKSQA
jgi:pimeloyl-ACP methyl ester carboxylesterase